MPRLARTAGARDGGPRDAAGRGEAGSGLSWRRAVALAALCLCFVATIAALVQRGGRWLVGTVTVALAGFTLVAVATFHAIRM